MCVILASFLPRPILAGGIPLLFVYLPSPGSATAVRVERNSKERREGVLQAKQVQCATSRSMHRLSSRFGASAWNNWRLGDRPPGQSTKRLGPG